MQHHGKLVRQLGDVGSAGAGSLVQIRGQVTRIRDGTVSLRDAGTPRVDVKVRDCAQLRRADYVLFTDLAVEGEPPVCVATDATAFVAWDERVLKLSRGLDLPESERASVRWLLMQTRDRLRGHTLYTAIADAVAGETINVIARVARIDLPHLHIADGESSMAVTLDGNAYDLKVGETVILEGLTVRSRHGVLRGVMHGIREEVLSNSALVDGLSDAVSQPDAKTVRDSRPGDRTVLQCRVKQCLVRRRGRGWKAAYVPQLKGFAFSLAVADRLGSELRVAVFGEAVARLIGAEACLANVRMLHDKMRAILQQDLVELEIETVAAGPANAWCVREIRLLPSDRHGL